MPSHLNENTHQLLHKIISILFFLLSCFCLVGLVTVYFNVFFSTQNLFDVEYFFIPLQTSPEIVLLPIYYMIVCLFYLWAGFRLRNHSKNIHITGLLGFVFIPLLSIFILKFVYTNLYNYTFFYTNALQEYSFYNLGRFKSIIDIILLILLILGVTLLALDREHNIEPKVFSKKQRFIFNSVCIFLLTGNLFLLSTVIFRTKTTDYGFKRVSEQVDFRLYRPAYIPDNRVYAKSYDFENTYSNKMRKPVTVTFSKVIGLRDPMPQSVYMINLGQTGLDEGFALNEYLKENYKIGESDNIKQSTIDIALSVDGKAHLIENTYLLSKNIVFVSKANTLIQTYSTDLPLAELIKFTESLQ